MNRITKPEHQLHSHGSGKDNPPLTVFLRRSYFLKQWKLQVTAQ